MNYSNTRFEMQPWQNCSISACASVHCAYTILVLLTCMYFSSNSHRHKANVGIGVYLHCFHYFAGLLSVEQK